MGTSDDKPKGGGAGDSLSHDPRTWMRSPPAGEPPASQPKSEPTPDPEPVKSAGPAATPPPSSDSFDPSTWAKSPARSSAGPPPAAAPKPARPTGAKRGPPPVILAAGVAVLVAAGGAAWWFSRGGEAKAPAAAAAAPTAAGPVAVSASMEQRVLTVAGPGALAASLTSAGVAPEEASAAASAAAAVLGADPGELRLELGLLPGQGGAMRVAELIVRRIDGSGVALKAGQGGAFAAQKLAAGTKVEVRLAAGEMDQESFYTSAVSAGVVDSLIPEFAQAFAFDFDFQREIKPGDRFEAVWEETVNEQGRPVGARRLLYASLNTAEKSKALYRFTPPGEKEAGWYDGAGRSIRRSLMRTPVEGARISSNFGFRTHPILGYTKLHKGTDFAAPTGTPIYAAGDGVIQVAAERGAAGNFISLLHDNGWRTTYMHLHTFAPVSVPNARVTQGTEIGQVGTTGRSTGPHLHFEVYIDGEPVDSMTIAVEQGVALQGPALAAFARERDRIDTVRAAAL